MKTKISIAAALVVTVLFLAGCQSSAIASGIPAGSNTAAPVLLTEAEAKELALKDAGFTADAVTNLRIEKDIDDGVTKYEVDFRQGDYEYDYEINAETGKITDYDKDLESTAKPVATEPVATDPVATDPAPTEAAPKTITEAEAKKIALEHAGLKEGDVTRLTVKKDVDDGITHYDVEFFKGNYEYDYEINAATGKITSYDKEKEVVKTAAPPATTNPATTKTITKDKAKAIALKHAGLKESEVTGLRVSLDKDDGRTYYEVDFRKGNVEYDYEINAETGKITEWDKDIDD